MATTMKAAVVRTFGAPEPGEVLVKVAACGVCHTDLHAAEGDWPVKPTLPFVPGHEGRASWRPSAPASVGSRRPQRRATRRAARAT